VYFFDDELLNFFPFIQNNLCYSISQLPFPLGFKILLCRLFLVVTFARVCAPTQRSGAFVASSIHGALLS